MAIPDFQSFFYPFLKMSLDKKEHSLNEAREFLANYFELSDKDRAEKVPSGSQSRFDNRIYWTKSYFIKAKLIKPTKRAHFKITKDGIDFFNKYQENISISNLKEIDSFNEFHSGVDKSDDGSNKITEEKTLATQTPLEKLEETFQFIRSELAVELLERVNDNSWQFFEDLVVDLMVQMGYGGSKNSARKSLQRTKDEGIDGIINEDKLGLDVIYLQAKKWKKGQPVGRPEIQKFVGALQGKRAKKGVFITTSYFANTAHEYIKAIDPKVILIDGKTLANLMIEHGLGTTVVESYIISKVNSDYFEK